MDRAPGDWYADESLWAEFYPFMFPASSFESAIHQVDQLIELTGVERGDLLDLGCGPGRYAVPFARRGFRVTGVDITPFLMEKARAYADAQAVDIELVAADMREFVRADAFDLTISMLTSFGYFDEPDENLAVLRNVLASLKPGGVFVFDTFGKEVIARKYEATSSSRLEDGSLIVQRRRVVSDWCQMENEWLLIREGEARVFRLRHWMYSGLEFKQLLAAAGFDRMRLYGDLEGSAYDPDARRLVAVARKARTPEQATSRL